MRAKFFLAVFGVAAVLAGFPFRFQETKAAENDPIGIGKTAGEKKILTVNGIDYTFCWCPAGEFIMGSPESEEGRYESEKQHRVVFTCGFWLLDSEVTQQMWRSLMPDVGCGTLPSAGEGPLYPIYNVNWIEAVEFCRRLSEHSGYDITLPTEAQWEYACRAGTAGQFGGTECLDTMGWYGENSGGSTHPVKEKEPNAWGLYDMHGNVWEWCADWYGYDYDISEQVDPVGPENGKFRVFRSGGWFGALRDARSANRDGLEPENRYCCPGLRPALIPNTSL